MEKIGRRLCGLRHRNNLTQEDLADKLGISQKTYSELERGNKMLSLDKVTVLAQIFRMETMDLLKELMSEETVNIYQTANNQQAITHSSQITIHNPQITREEFEKLEIRVDSVFEMLLNLLKKDK